MADRDATTGEVPGEVPGAPPTAETPVPPYAPGAGGVAVAPPTAENPAMGYAAPGGAGVPPNPPYAPWPYAPYPWGPPPGGMPYPVSAPPDHRTVSMSRLGAALGGLVLLLVGVGIGVGIGAAVWAGSAARVAARGPRIVTPTGSIHIGPGRRLPITGLGTPAPARPGNGGFGFGGGGFGGTTGSITKVSGTTVTVKRPDGSTVTVKVPSSAKITVTKPGATSDLSSGACVRIVGGRTAPPAAGGSSAGNARAVQVLPSSACSTS